MRAKWVRCDVWRTGFWFCLGMPEKEFRSFMHKSFDSRVDVSRNAGAMFTVTPGDTGPIFVIWTRKKRDIPPLAHELLHAVNSVLHHAGVKPDFEDDESQAYLLTWVMEKALESIK